MKLSLTIFDSNSCPPLIQDHAKGLHARRDKEVVKAGAVAGDEAQIGLLVHIHSELQAARKFGQIDLQLSVCIRIEFSRIEGRRQPESAGVLGLPESAAVVRPQGLVGVQGLQAAGWAWPQPLLVFRRMVSLRLILQELALPRVPAQLPESCPGQQRKRAREPAREQARAPERIRRRLRSRNCCHLLLWRHRLVAMAEEVPAAHCCRQYHDGEHSGKNA